MMKIPIIVDICGWQKEMYIDESLMRQGIIYIDIKPPMDYMVMRPDLIVDGSIHRIKLRRVGEHKFKYVPSYSYNRSDNDFYDNIPLEHELDSRLFEI